MPLPNQGREYSYADYLTWPDDERWEIIDGTPYMQAAPSPEHQLIAGELYRQIANYLQGKHCKAYLAPFCVRLPSMGEKQNEEIKNVVEPDITIICDKSKIDEKGCNGAPDMIIEVMSPSSIKRDRLIKFNKYEKAGIKEYWIVEPEGKIVSVFLLESNSRYCRPEIYTDEDKITVSTFSGLVVDLSLVFSEK